MKVPYKLDQFDDAVRHVYGEPYQTADGTTLITVAKVRSGRGKRHPDDGGDDVIATPMGVFVFRAERARWVPVFDMNQMALIGAITGLVAAVFGSLAVLRRPPWPDLSDWSAQGR